MRYTVHWRGRSHADLFAALNDASDKQTVFAAEVATARLRRSPRRAGESRDTRDRRVVYIGPLFVVFTVSRADRIVYVERVRWIGPPP
jgi:hypothetical protein